ncbi:solute carrier organic anion transporter [Tamlana crocina]|uniref:Solute carrier organic anion transporter n=1 Tax=Tamlana crocina TaxID=393006 RepID=A0ABX1DAI5_9FLAO|nr:solute carrier organic anion transporter [Tamlana crocina]NJX14129.1 solute carrier organic anion transporter [Tamlana crocina]
MKTSFFTALLTLICFSFMAFQCDDNDSATMEEEQTELRTLKAEIESFASQSECNTNTECQYIAFGSKPCGGPWGYLVYSTSIDTEKLKQMVEDYNQKEADFNTKWGIMSDCALAPQPSSVNCENNTCVAVY